VPTKLVAAGGGLMFVNEVDSYKYNENAWKEIGKQFAKNYNARAYHTRNRRQII